MYKRQQFTSTEIKLKKAITTEAAITAQAAITSNSNIATSAAIAATGNITANSPGKFAGDGSLLTSLNPASIASGALGSGVTSATISNKPAWYLHTPKAGDNTSEFSVARNTDVIINNWQSDESGANAESGVNTSNGDFTIPTGRGGMYVIFAGAALVNLDNVDDITVFFFKNGVKLLPAGDNNSPADNITTGASLIRLANFAANDVIQAGVRHNHSQYSLSLYGIHTYFGGFRLAL